MKPFNHVLTGALALATLAPLTAYAQGTPTLSTPTLGTPTLGTPVVDATIGTTATTTTTTAPLDSTTPPADSAAVVAPSATAAVAAGATVYGSDGAPVGKIASVVGGNAVVDTGTRKATLALNAFGSGPQGPTITVTKAQLEDAVAKATPPAPAASEPPAKGKRSKDKAGR